MSNSNLTNAKRAKNDEFYTQFNDIEAEITAYYEYNHEVFRNKIVLCPCDDPEWSNFVNFFATNFKRYGLKALISTSYAKSGTSDKLTDREKNSPYYDEKKHKTCGKLFVMTGDMNNDGRIDSDDVCFYKYLEGDGDFRSDEVTKLRDEADIIVTNPPFSLFRDFIKWIMEGNKQFAVIGNMNAISYKEIFPLIRDNKIWLGTTNPKEFVEPNGNIKKFGNINWFTNLDHGIRHEKMMLDTMANNLRFNKSLHKKLAKYGDPNHYPKYDNYDAIEVPITKCIPSNYKGVMGVPISFLDKYNPDQFEIVSFRKGNDGKDLVFTRGGETKFNLTFVSLYDSDPRDDQERRRKNKWENYLRTNHDKVQKEPVDVIFPLATNLNNGLVNDCTVNGKKTYVRMLIRHKQSK